MAIGMSNVAIPGNKSIGSISVNGKNIVPKNRNVDISVPTKISQLENDKNFLTENVKYSIKKTNREIVLSGTDKTESKVTISLASEKEEGFVSLAAQTFKGEKTFVSPVYFNGATNSAIPQGRNISSGSQSVTTTNCPNGALYGQYQ